MRSPVGGREVSRLEERRRLRLFRHAGKQAGPLELTDAEVCEARGLSRHYAIFVAAGVPSILLAWSRIGLIMALPGLIYWLIGPACHLHARFAPWPEP